MVVDDEPPALEVLRTYIQRVQSLELSATCSDAIQAFHLLKQHPIDLIFLDIQMPQILGTDFLRALKNAPKVIFTTAYRKFAVEGFELEAVDYLLKPISFERFLKAVNRVMDNPVSLPGLQEEKSAVNTAFIYFRSDRRMIKVILDDILYIESLKDYIRIVTVQSTIITKQSISSLEEQLPHEKFLRIHRSFIISTNRISSYTHELVWVGQTELPISRMYRHEVEKILRLKK